MKNFSDSSPRILLPTLIAVGGSLIAAPASAMGLSEIKVHSTLGQPLRASIAYALGPNEAINSRCVTVQSGLSASGLPAVSRASIVVANGIIAISGRAAVREPMMAINVNIRCPYAARVNREYTLFIDPAGTMPQLVAAPVVAPIARPVAAPVVRPAPVAKPIVKPEVQPVVVPVVTTREPAVLAATIAYAPPYFQALQEPEAIVIPDTVLEGPNVPVATIQPTATIRPVAPPEQSPTNWLTWLVSGGIAIITGLLFFGRFRERFGSAPIGAAAAPVRRQTVNNVEPYGVIGDVEIDDDAPTADTTALDIALPEETFEEVPSGALSSETDIIPPLNFAEESILMNEELPEEDDYDMSVMIDATKMPRPEDVTERDLEVVQVEVGDGTLISSDYTISQEVDYEIVEQDYEEEMTATQALNKEIAKAASELADRMDDLPLASVTELDITAQLPEQDDEPIGDLDDTGINPAINVAADS